MSIFRQEQYVCQACGFNMIGYFPDNCPFCGASKEIFITAKECSNRYTVVEQKVNETVTCLNSDPSFGLEHNAFKIEMDNKIIWIDCPSTFNKAMDSFHINLFTHHHFIAAANLYKNYFSSEMWIHHEDSNNYIANKYEFDNLFNSDFKLGGIKAFPIDGHTSGFTAFIFEECLFICDYIFIKSNTVKFNPYGSYSATLKGGKQLKKIIEKERLRFVCGYNYVLNFDSWNTKFLKLLRNA